jgi:hypothetical protein
MLLPMAFHREQQRKELEAFRPGTACGAEETVAANSLLPSLIPEHVHHPKKKT